MQLAGGEIGGVLQAHLDALAVELRGARRPERLRETIDELMRVQAILAVDADAAAGCLDGAADAALVEPLRALARQLFDAHRARISAIRAGESSRAGYVARRLRAKQGRCANTPATADECRS